MVYLIDLPVSVRGFTIKNSDESFTIFINARMNAETQCATYDHEMRHIENNDFEYVYSIDDLECLRHVV